MSFSEINRVSHFAADLTFWGSHEPVHYNPGLYNSNPSPITSNSGPDEPVRKISKTSSACLSDRKQRRMISNRESARRSRVRKQKYVEDLNNELDGLRIENRKLIDRFRQVACNNEVIHLENEQLRWEAVVLRQHLTDLSQVLFVRRQLEQQILMINPLSASLCMNNLTYNNEEQLNAQLFNCVTN